MREFTFKELADITGGKIVAGSGDAVIDRISTDSREVIKGQLFIPIIGEVHDAHKFIPSAMENGCDAFFISREDMIDTVKDCNAILVDDTLKAMQRLAKFYLHSLNLKKVVVTGSIGKTSTRDMMHAILKEKFVTGCTMKNFNSDVGVPHTIFSFDDTMEAAVLEAGMDQPGDIDRLVEIIRPEIGIITYVGTSHIERLGSRENIFKAKMEVTNYFGKGNTLIINNDNDMLSTLTDDKEYEIVRAGSDERDSYRVSDVDDFGEQGIEYTLTAGGKAYRVKLSIPGAHNALNSALAIAAGEKMGVSIEEAIRGLSKIELTGRRLNIRERDGIRVIDDTYNASPESMKSAVTTLMHTEADRRIAVLGGINELGAMSDEGHYSVGRFVAQQEIDYLYTISEPAEAIWRGFVEGGGDPERAKHFDTKADFFKIMEGLFRDGDVILIKASRGRELEEVVEKIMEG